MDTVPITVLMPVHNAERYVLGAVESILGQSWGEFEFLIVNDGSTDGTRDRLAGVKDPRLRIVDTERAGVAGALRLGLQLARGRYIARMDADDESLPHRLARQKACLDEQPGVGMVHSRAELIDGKGRPLGRIRGNLRSDVETRWLLVWQNVPVHPTVMLRAELLERHGLTYRLAFDRAEDFDLWSRLSLVADLHLIPEVLLHYRLHPGSVTEGSPAEPLSRVYSRVIFHNFERYGVPVSEAVAAELAVIGGGTLNPITYRYRHLRETLPAVLEAVSQRFCERFGVAPSVLHAVQAEQLIRWARYMLGTSRPSTARLLWAGLRRRPAVLATYLFWAVLAGLLLPLPGGSHGQVTRRKENPAGGSAAGAPIRVTIVISQLGGGGMERTACTMVNHWAAAGWATTVLTFTDGTTPPFYELDPRVRHVPLGIAQVSANPLAGLRSNLRRLGVLRRSIRESAPDVVLGFMNTTNVLALIATRGLGVPVVASEHLDPSQHRIGRVWESLRWLTYRWADRLAVNSESFRGYFPRPVQSRTVVLPSPVVLDGWPGDSPDVRWSRPVVLVLGRLTPVKGLDLLLEAFARLRTRFPEWTLVVLGEGPIRAELEQLRDRLGLAGRVHFPGRFSNPRTALAQADLFVLPSRSESFPMALCEALASGLPVITTEYHPGVHDIVRAGVDAVVVPPEDVAALAAAMERLMADPAERRRLGARATEITERFGLERVMQRWSALLEEAVRREPA